MKVKKLNSTIHLKRPKSSLIARSNFRSTNLLPKITLWLGHTSDLKRIKEMSIWMEYELWIAVKYLRVMNQYMNQYSTWTSPSWGFCLKGGVLWRAWSLKGWFWGTAIAPCEANIINAMKAISFSNNIIWNTNLRTCEKKATTKSSPWNRPLEWSGYKWEKLWKLENLRTMNIAYKTWMHVPSIFNVIVRKFIYPENV